MQGTIERIDVLWLNRNRIEDTFEIESTTAIYSGLLRMSDLLAMQPNIDMKLLAPLLHAAALEERPVGDMLAWVDAQDEKTPGAILAEAGADAAKRQLDSVVNLNPRNKGTTYMSAGSLLAAYRFPRVASVAGNRIAVDSFLDGGANTLYVIASERQQRLLAPLVVAMIASILDEAAHRANLGAPLEPTLRVLLDEAANIAPLRALPAYLAQAGGKPGRALRDRLAVVGSDPLALPRWR